MKLQRSIVAAMAVGLLIDKSYWDSLHSRTLGSTTVNTAGSLVVKKLLGVHVTRAIEVLSGKGC